MILHRPRHGDGQGAMSSIPRVVLVESRQRHGMNSSQPVAASSRTFTVRSAPEVTCCPYTDQFLCNLGDSYRRNEGTNPGDPRGGRSRLSNRERQRAASEGVRTTAKEEERVRVPMVDFSECPPRLSRPLNPAR